MHGQHEHQTLLDPTTHLDVLDTFGSLDSLLAPTAAAFDAMRASQDELARLRAAAKDRDSRLDLVTFQLGELDRAGLKAMAPGEAGEDVEAAALRQVLASAERVERLCAEGYAALYERDDAILAGLSGVWRRVAELAALDPRFKPYLDARDGIKSQLEDLAAFLRKYADGIEASPAKLQQLEERLALLERLKRKYGPTLADVVARRDALRRELNDLASGDDRIAELERAAAAARGRFLETAGRLSSERRRAAKALGQRLEALLAELAMERTRFAVRFAEAVPESAWTPRGTCQSFVSPTLARIASLARIVSGGAVAHHARDRALTATRGSVSVTPPIPCRAPRRRASSSTRSTPASARASPTWSPASCGARVGVPGAVHHAPPADRRAATPTSDRKAVEAGRTQPRSASERSRRVDELARMLGGDTITDGLRRSAREMLGARHADRGGESERAKGESARNASKSRASQRSQR